MSETARLPAAQSCSLILLNILFSFVEMNFGLFMIGSFPVRGLGTPSTLLLDSSLPERPWERLSPLKCLSSLRVCVCVQHTGHDQLTVDPHPYWQDDILNDISTCWVTHLAALWAAVNTCTHWLFICQVCQSIQQDPKVPNWEHQ